MSAPSGDREPVEKLAEEFAQRYRRGERPSLTEYVQKYPHLGDEIRELFPALVLMEKFGSVAGAAPGAGPIASDARRPTQLGEYRILREVGRGGMGVVYEAVQESLGRHVALKVLPFHGLLNANHLERFRREARVAARLHHTNIVPVFGVGAHEGIHYYAMQFIHGQGLDAVLRELQQMRRPRTANPLAPAAEELSASIAEGLVSGRFQCGEPADREPALTSGTTPTSSSTLAGQSESQYSRSVARVGVQVAEALAYAHQHGVLHRDVKPSNLLLDTRGTVWVTDFGLAKAEGSDELTGPGDIVGTIRYMAPERFRGAADPRSDVYGLGMTLYELLTLCPAFEDSNRARLMVRVANEDPPPPRQRDPNVPRDLETIVLKAIAREPADRYAGAEALAEDLRRFLADRSIQARRSSGLERAWRWCRRNPVVAALSAAVACSLLLGATIAVLFGLDARDKAADADRRRREAESHLYHSLLGEARAQRLARGSGYRSRVWELLKKARGLDTSERDLDELRAEAVACMGDFVGLEPGVWEVRGIGRAPGPRLALHPDGTQLALGLGDGTVLVRHLATGDEVALRHHSADVSAVAFTPDRQRLVTGDVQGTVNVWERDPAGTWIWARTFQAALPHEPPLFPNEFALAISPDGREVATCPAAGTALQVWDLADGTLTAELHGPRDEPLRGPAWSPDGRLLAAGYSAGEDAPARFQTEERGILVWDVAKRHCVRSQPLNLGLVFTVTFSPDGRLVAAGCTRGSAVFAMSDLPDPAARVVGLLGSPFGQGALPAASALMHRRADLREGFLMRGDVVHSLAFSPDGHRLFVPSLDLGVVRLWDLSANRPVATLQHPGGPSAVALSKDGETLFAASRQSVRFWKLRAPAEKRVPSGHAGGVPGLAFSPDGRLLASVGKDRTVKVWHPATGRLVQNLTGFRGEVQAAAFSPDGRTLATADWAGDLRLWDVQIWQNQPVPNHDLGRWLWHVAFSPDGTWFAAAGEGGLSVWRVPGRGAGAAPASPPLEPLAAVVRGEKITALCFSPDSKRLAWVTKGADADSYLSLCDLPACRPRPLRSARPHGFVLPVAFAADSRHLSFVSDQQVEVWDVVNGRKVDSYGSAQLVSGNGIIALSDDGAWLASSGNRSITIWDTESHKPLLVLPEERSTVWSLAWSPNREQLAVGSSDGGPVLWNIGQIRAQLRALILD